MQVGLEGPRPSGRRTMFQSSLNEKPFEIMLVHLVVVFLVEILCCSVLLLFSEGGHTRSIRGVFFFATHPY